MATCNACLGHCAVVACRAAVQIFAATGTLRTTGCYHLVVCIYYNLLATAKYWVGEGFVPPVIGLWWVPVLPVLLMIVLLNSERLLCRFRFRQ